jgi:hypothetical protein
MFFLLPTDLRVSDADRDAAAEEIKAHYAAGRLGDAEMSARVDAAYAASYESELVALTRDLPELSPDPRLAHRPLRGAVLVSALAIGVVALASLAPPELWTLALGLGLPLLMMVLVTVAPLAVPALAVVWLLRGLARPGHSQRGRLPR